MYIKSRGFNKNVKSKFKSFDTNCIVLSPFGKISILPENPKGPMNSVLQDILRYRYIDDYPWKEIINLLCPDNDAFIDMTESNLRKLHKWNGQALLKFIKCQGYLSTIT